MANSILNQSKLHALSQRIMGRFDEISECLHISLKKNNKYYYGPCPIHGGDKFNAINIYHVGNECIGNWKCHTQECHKYFVGSIIGFIRGVLSHQKYGWCGKGDETVSFQETLDFISSCLNENYSNIDIDFDAVERAKFVKMASLCQNNINQPTFGMAREKVRATLKIPATYFVQRNFSSQILDKYDVGLCDDPREDTYNRVVVPIYDNLYERCVGYTSRSIYDKCAICNTWHSPKISCPSKSNKAKYAKWKHSSGFKKDANLYNYWFASPHIQSSKVCVLTESPGNVWRLEEAGIPVGLGTYGASFNFSQKLLLDKSGAMTIILAQDNDEAGQSWVKEIMSMCAKTHRIYTFAPPTTNDIGDMTIEQMRSTLLPLYHSCVKEWVT